jgi:hypothetical protein
MDFPLDRKSKIYIRKEAQQPAHLGKESTLKIKKLSEFLLFSIGFFS